MSHNLRRHTRAAVGRWLTQCEKRDENIFYKLKLISSWCEDEFSIFFLYCDCTFPPTHVLSVVTLLGLNVSSIEWRRMKENVGRWSLDVATKITKYPPLPSLRWCMRLSQLIWISKRNMRIMCSRDLKSHRLVVFVASRSHKSLFVSSFAYYCSLSFF